MLFDSNENQKFLKRPATGAFTLFLFVFARKNCHNKLCFFFSEIEKKTKIIGEKVANRDLG